MTRSALALALSIALALPLAAQENEIESVIADQFADFSNDDFAAAFEHASPTIRGLFGTAENFELMVRRGYPMVQRPGKYRFLDLSETAGGRRQMVEVFDAQGRRHLLRYDMVETESGWKINGVAIIPATDFAA